MSFFALLAVIRTPFPVLVGSYLYTKEPWRDTVFVTGCAGAIPYRVMRKRFDFQNRLKRTIEDTYPYKVLVGRGVFGDV